MRKAIFGENNRKLEKSANEFMRKIQTNGTIQVKPDNLAAFVRSMMIFSMKNEPAYSKFLKDNYTVEHNVGKDNEGLTYNRLVPRLDNTNDDI